MALDPRRRRLFALVTLLGGTAMSLLVAEVALRLFWGGYYVATPSLHMQPNAFLGWEHAPGASFEFLRAEYRTTITYDRRGFRVASGDVPERAPEGRVRVACIGDSFTVGLGAGDRETFPARLEAREPRIEAIDAGVSGYGPHQELAMLRSRVLGLAPAAVVWQVCANDIDNLVTLDIGYSVDGGGALVEGPPVARFAPRRVSTRATIIQAGRRSYLFRATVDVATALVKRWGYRPQREPTPADEGAWRLLGAVLRAGEEACRARGVRLLVLVVPHADQVYRPGEAAASVVEFSRRVREACLASGIALLDLEAPLAAARTDREDERLYHVVDGHLTPRGYDVAAQAILAELRRLGWAPPAPAAGGR